MNFSALILRCFLGVLALGASSIGFAQGPQKLTEESLVQMARTQSVAAKGALASEAAVSLNASLNDETYQTRLVTGFNARRTDEEPMTQFQPNLTPFEDWRLELEKKFPLGVSSKVGVFGSQYSLQNGDVKSATQVGVKVGAQIDLWKNLFGKIDRAQLQSQNSKRVRAELQNQVSIKKGENEIRKLYWSLIAAEQSLELSEKLVQSAEKQVLDVKKRAAEGAADAGEVARYQSQVESRKSSVLLYRYEKEMLMSGLRRSLTGFDPNQWSLELIVSPTKEASVLQCLNSVAKLSQIDVNNTLLDDMLSALREETSNEIKIAKTHSDINVQLAGEYQTTGVANSYKDANTRLNDKKFDGYAVSLNLIWPLGKADNKSEKLLLQLKENSLEVEAVNLENDLQVTHASVIQSLKLLQAGLGHSQENSKNLERSYRSMEQKFKQGRVSVSQLIFEQETLFQSKLQEISLKKQITHALLDYLSVFGAHPCSWNQI